MDYSYIAKAFFLLGIERFLYGFWFHFPQKFIEAAKNGSFGAKIKSEKLYWRSAQLLGMYVKVFQFSVITFDLLVVCDLTDPMSSYGATARASIGVTILAVGQALNYAVFKALGAIGVYYGYEFGFEVKRVSCFPYNIGIGDPQYWGVVLSIWGMYLMVGASSYIIPMFETFWYVCSMKILENPRGKTILKMVNIVN